MKTLPPEWRETVRESAKALRSTHFFRVLGVLGLLLFLASLAMYLVEHEPDKNQGLWDSIWWSLVTVTTVGYGDIVPKTVIGRLIAFGVMVAGLVLVSLLTASIASVFVSRRIKEDKGLEDLHVRDHILVCGWNENVAILLQGLTNQFKPKVPIIVLVNELSRENIEPVLYKFKELDFRYVRGDFTRENVLNRANLRYARTAVILSDTSGVHPHEKADERTIFGAMAIKSMYPGIKVCAELMNSENKEHLSRANVDEIVVRGEYNARHSGRSRSRDRRVHGHEKAL